MIDIYSKHDRMQRNGMFYDLICINNHIILCINYMLSLVLSRCLFPSLSFSSLFFVLTVFLSKSPLLLCFNCISIVQPNSFSRLFFFSVFNQISLLHSHLVPHFCVPPFIHSFPLFFCFLIHADFVSLVLLTSLSLVYLHISYFEGLKSSIRGLILIYQ